MAATSDIVIREVEENPEDTPLRKKQLLSQTMRILIPTDVSSLLWISSQTITLYFVGKYLKTVGTAQYSASIVIFNMCAYSVIMGFGAAIDTLSSQAFGADPKSPEVGETLQMALALNMVLGLVFTIFFVYSEPLMCFLFEEEICVGVSMFLRYSPPYLFAQIISGVTSKSMYAQKLPELVVIANAVAAIGSPLSNYIFTPLGIHGAALALGATVGLSSLTHILCLIFHPKVIVRYAPWPSPKLVSLKAWREFFRVGIPALIATCAEWWAFELQTVIASKISTSALAIHGVAMNLVNLLFSVSLGMSVAASVIVGNSLGSGRPGQAKQFAYFVLGCDLILGLITAALMLLFGTHIAHFYGDEEDVIEGVKTIIPLVALCHISDSVAFCQQGIFRGAGRPAQAGLAVLLTLWCVGVPASIIFVFLMNFGVYGCIGGMIVGMYCEIPLLGWWMYKFDWAQLGLEARATERKPRVAMDVVIENSSNSEDSVSLVSSRSTSVSSTNTHSSRRHRVYAHGEYERELHERTASILEEACCSLHNSFAVPLRNR